MAIISPILLLLLSGYIVSSKIGTTKDTKHKFLTYNTERQDKDREFGAQACVQ